MYRDYVTIKRLLTLTCYSCILEFCDFGLWETVMTLDQSIVRQQTDQ